MKKQVLIADADERFRNELVTALEDNDEFEVIGVATDGEGLCKCFKQNRQII